MNLLLSSAARNRHHVRVIGKPGVAPAAGAWVDGTTAIFRVSDPGHRLAGVRLSQDVRIPYPAELTEVPDMHNYTAWRDAFHPHLTRLVRQVCG